MLYEIGLFYPDKETNVQVKIPNIPISANRRRFFFGGKTISHWDEDTTNTWVKVPVLNGTTKIYLDDSANKDLSNIDETMIFGDDFRNETSLDTSKWDYTPYCSEQLGSFSSTGDAIDLHVNNGANFSGTGTFDTATINGNVAGWFGHAIRTKMQFNSSITIETYFYHNDLYSDKNSGDDGLEIGLEISDDGGQNRIIFFSEHNDSRFQLRVNNNGNLSEYVSNEFQTGYHKMIFNQLVDSTIIQADNYDSAQYSSSLSNYFIVLSADVRNVGDQLNSTFYYIFARKHLPADPKVLYIRPYHHWWLFETFGGITKLFRASVLEALTKNKSNRTNSNEQNTQVKDNPTNVTEENAQEKENTVNSLEENTQSNITEASAEEGIANVANIIADSIESIINEFDFATSSLEQISNTITDKTSAIEANTQNKEFVISTLEKMINEFDFYASACELVQNTIEAKINANEQLTHIKDGKTSTNEQIAYMYEFLTNALENTIKTVKSETTSKEALTKQIADYINSGEFLTHIKQDEISTNEQIAYAYIFATNTLEQISNARKDIASVQEKLANNQIDIANALEEIYHIDLSARPIFLSSLKAIGTLTTHIKKVF